MSVIHKKGLNARLMKLSNSYLNQFYRQLCSRLGVISHRGFAWIIGPILISTAAISLALASEEVARFQRAMVGYSRFLPLVMLPLGFMVLAFLVGRYFNGAQGSGIPQTIAELDNASDEKSEKRLSVRILLGKILLTIGGLSIGASIGREGPTVQIGASIMHWFYGKGPFQNAELRRTLIVAGGAAGIASAFNTPLAGLMFAIEELSKKHLFTANSSTLVTIIVSGLISVSFLGSYTYFGTSPAQLLWSNGIGAILLCALVGGLAGGSFSRLLIGFLFDLPARLASLIEKHKIVFSGLCGFLIALLGLLSDGVVYGTGYEPTRALLEGQQNITSSFGIAKFFATLLSAVSGITGGIFAPSLAVGAGIGDNLSTLVPMLADRSAIILLVMVAYLSGVTRAPVTSFLIMMEMTNSHQMLIPLMATSVIASTVAKFVCPVPLYHKLAERFTA